MRPACVPTAIGEYDDVVSRLAAHLLLSCRLAAHLLLSDAVSGGDDVGGKREDGVYTVHARAQL